MEQTRWSSTVQLVEVVLGQTVLDEGLVTADRAVGELPAVQLDPGGLVATGMVALVQLVAAAELGATASHS
jgi:hypothetical protein